MKVLIPIVASIALLSSGVDAVIRCNVSAILKQRTQVVCEHDRDNQYQANAEYNGASLVNGQWAWMSATESENGGAWKSASIKVKFGGGNGNYQLYYHNTNSRYGAGEKKLNCEQNTNGDALWMSCSS